MFFVRLIAVYECCDQQIGNSVKDPCWGCPAAKEDRVNSYDYEQRDNYCKDNSLLNLSGTDGKLEKS